MDNAQMVDHIVELVEARAKQIQADEAKTLANAASPVTAAAE